MSRTGVVLLVAVLLSFAEPALAATTAAFEVSAEITPGCRIRTEGEASSGLGVVDFGSHVVDEPSRMVTGSLLQSSSVRVQCTQGTAVSMSVNGGNYQADGVRHMRAGMIDGAIPYQVYRDAALSTEWQIDTPQALDYLDPNNILIPLYIKAVLNRSLPGGTYGDVLTITFSW